MRWHHRLGLLILLLTCATAAHAQLSAYNTIALQSGGQAIPKPTVTVCVHVQPPTNPCTGTLATLSIDSAGDSLTNPFQGDGAGNINFWTAPGTYDISVAAPVLNLPTNTYSFTLGNASGGAAFNAITSGTNLSAAMLVGTGASLGPTGSGTITATTMPWSGLTSFPAGCTNQVITALLTTPTCTTLTSAFLPAALVYTSQTNVYGAFLQDFTSGTMEIPEAAGFTANVNSTIGLDLTANITHLWTNNADSLAAATTGTSTTTTQPLFATAVAGIYGARAIATGDLPTAIPIGNVGTSGLSGTAPVTINAAGAIGCATCVTSSAALTNNVLVKGAGGQATQVSLATDNGTTMTYTGTGGYSAPVLVSTVATGTAPLTITSTTPVANLTLSTAAQVPSLPLNQIISPTGAVATFADGNNPVTVNCAQTTNNQDCWTFGETSAATNGTLTNLLANQAELHAATASASTATPLEVEQAGCTATTCAPLAQFESTWNNASLVGQGIIENVTNTSSAASSLLMNLQVNNATVSSVDKTGYTVESIASMTTGNQIISGADYTNSTTTPSTVFTWTLPATAAAKTYRYSCDMMWESTNTTLTGPQFGVNISAAPTQLTAANAAQNTLAGADINGYISNTTTGHQNVGVGTAAGVTNTNYWARMWGTIEGAPTAGSTFIIDAAALSNTTSTVNIRRGSSCQLTATN